MLHETCHATLVHVFKSTFTVFNSVGMLHNRDIGQLFLGFIFRIKMDYDPDEICCKNCSTVLMEPYIHCVECSSNNKEPVPLCLHCFAKGVEFEGHQSDHPYTVIVSYLGAPDKVGFLV